MTRKKERICMEDMMSEGITYQNKDILFKILSQT